LGLAGPHSVGSTQADGYPAICDIAYGTNQIYSPSSNYNVGDTFYTTDEAAYVVNKAKQFNKEKFFKEVIYIIEYNVYIFTPSVMYIYH
jgi:hypothetical protein